MRFIQTQIWDDELPGEKVLTLRRVIEEVHPAHPDAYVRSVCDEVRRQFAYALEDSLRGREIGGK